MRRGQRYGIALSALVAFVVGIIAALSLLLGGNPALFGDQPGSVELAALLALPADVLLRLAVIVAALSIVIGIVNLLFTHVLRLRRAKLMSAVLLASFAFTMAWLVMRPGDASLLEAAQLPIESALAALLCLSLVYGGSRVLAKRADIWGACFVIVVLVVLLASLPLAELAPLQAWRDWLMRIPVSAGARAILLGIALGTLVAGVRALLAQDRSLRG